jgi:hypothetical protein
MVTGNMSCICPVCGFHLGFQPWYGLSPSDEICPCCGIQFGYSDFAGGDEHRRRDVYARWRQDWIGAGMPWRGRGTAPPPGWNPAAQLNQLTDRSDSE